MSLTQEKVPFRLKYWVRLALFVVCVLAVLIGSNVGVPGTHHTQSA